jgi:hypothetical protein
MVPELQGLQICTPYSFFKAFSGTYEALGESLCDVDSLVIANFDATANDIPPGIVVKGSNYPHLLLFAARGKQNPIEYTGSKNIPDMLLFLKGRTRYVFHFIMLTRSLAFSLRCQRWITQKQS